MPEGVGGELVHLHREGVWRDVHVPHDREHAKAGGKPEHHVPVPALEPVLPLAELFGMLVDGSVGKVVHDRGLDRGCPVGKDEVEHIVGEQVPDQLAFRHPPEVADIGDRLVVDELL